MIRHFLADGREVASIEGYVIPPTGPTAAVYRIAADVIQNNPEIISKKKEEKSHAKKFNS